MYHRYKETKYILYYEFYPILPLLHSVTSSTYTSNTKTNSVKTGNKNCNQRGTQNSNFVLRRLKSFGHGNFDNYTEKKYVSHPNSVL